MPQLDLSITFITERCYFSPTDLRLDYAIPILTIHTIYIYIINDIVMLTPEPQPRPNYSHFRTFLSG